jgi:hypothetical protein
VKSRITKSLLGGVALAAVVVLVNPASASAATATGTATFTGGTLSFTSPATIAFPATLTGAQQNVTASQAFDVSDNTGSAAGWNITATSTTWTAGANTLSLTGTTDLSASGACDVAAACTIGTNAPLTYPVTIPAATVAPTAVKIQTAAAGTGIAPQTWTHSMQLAIPANAKAGTYTSTWTYSLTSAP